MHPPSFPNICQSEITVEQWTDTEKKFVKKRDILRGRYREGHIFFFYSYFLRRALRAGEKGNAKTHVPSLTTPRTRGPTPGVANPLSTPGRRVGILAVICVKLRGCIFSCAFWDCIPRIASNFCLPPPPSPLSPVPRQFYSRQARAGCSREHFLKRNGRTKHPHPRQRGNEPEERDAFFACTWSRARYNQILDSFPKAAARAMKPPRDHVRNCYSNWNRSVLPSERLACGDFSSSNFNVN